MPDKTLIGLIIAIIVVIVIVFVFTRGGSSNNCHLQKYSYVGREPLGVVDACTLTGGVWNETNKTCVNELTGACNNPSGFMKDACALEGGTYTPGCNICSGVDVESTNMSSDQFVMLATKYCPNFMQ